MKANLQSPRSRRLHRWCAVGTLLLLPAAAAIAQDGVACWAHCARETHCALSIPSTGEEDRSLKLDDKHLQTVADCGSRQAVAGDVVVKYRHRQQLITSPAPLKQAQTVGSLFANYAPDRCSLPNRACLQQDMQQYESSRAGHGIDDQRSAPAGQGEPCSLGLPCGIVIPQPSTWRFRLADMGFSGTWRVRVLRGQPPPGAPAQVEARVVNGAVAANGALFAPGMSYAYSLHAADGSLRAGGEFTVLSAAQYAALQRMVDKRIAAGLSRADAWQDALAANHLDWDVIQRTNP